MPFHVNTILKSLKWFTFGRFILFGAVYCIYEQIRKSIYSTVLEIVFFFYTLSFVQSPFIIFFLNDGCFPSRCSVTTNCVFQF